MAKNRNKKSNKESKTKAPRVYRDAATGRFVTKKYAKRNRQTTVKERRTTVTRVDDSTSSPGE